MEDTIREARPVEVRAERRPMRAISIFAAIALVLGGVALARHAADPAPKADVVVDQGPQIDNVGGAIGQTLGFGAAIQPQIDVGAIVCPILTLLAAAFGAFIGPIIASLRVLFGCAST